MKNNLLSPRMQVSSKSNNSFFAEGVSPYSKGKSPIGNNHFFQKPKNVENSKDPTSPISAKQESIKSENVQQSGSLNSDEFKSANENTVTNSDVSKSLERNQESPPKQVETSKNPNAFVNLGMKFRLPSFMADDVSAAAAADVTPRFQNCNANFG